MFAGKDRDIKVAKLLFHQFLAGSAPDFFIGLVDMDRGLVFFQDRNRHGIEIDHRVGTVFQLLHLGCFFQGAVDHPGKRLVFCCNVTLVHTDGEIPFAGFYQYILKFL